MVLGTDVSTIGGFQTSGDCRDSISRRFALLGILSLAAVRTRHFLDFWLGNHGRDSVRSMGGPIHRQRAATMIGAHEAMSTAMERFMLAIYLQCVREKTIYSTLVLSSILVLYLCTTFSI